MESLFTAMLRAGTFCWEWASVVRPIWSRVQDRVLFRDFISCYSKYPLTMCAGLQIDSIQFPVCLAVFLHVRRIRLSPRLVVVFLVDPSSAVAAGWAAVLLVRRIFIGFKRLMTYFTSHSKTSFLNLFGEIWRGRIVSSHWEQTSASLLVKPIKLSKTIHAAPGCMSPFGPPRGKNWVVKESSHHCIIKMWFEFVIKEGWRPCPNH